MGGIGLALAVGLVAILIGAGIGYAIAAGRFAAQLFASLPKPSDPESLPAKSFDADPMAASAASSGAAANATVADAPVRTPALTRLPWEPLVGETTESSAESQAASAGTSATPQRPAIAPLTSSPADEDPAGTLTSFIAIAHQAGALMMVDVDYLGQFRERYGPQLAEYVANHVEGVIREALRETAAVISRYEAQEFLIALPDIAGAPHEKIMAARRLASTLRAEIQRAFLQVGSERLTITASVGVALLERGVASEDVITRADEALHAAKKAGRNCAYYQHAGRCLPVDPLTETAEATELKPMDNIGNLNTPGRRVACRDRRRHVRMPCRSVNLIAPCRDDIVPMVDKFERVQFLDLSVSGFSMILPAVPTVDRFCVALFNHRGMIFMSATVVNIRQAPRAGHTKPLVIVGCRFLRRLHPDQPMPNLFHESLAQHAEVADVLQSL